MDTSGDKQRVLEATDIVRLVGEHVSLKKKGREWICLCPFHDDHNPSMYVVPAKQIYHCFVCGAGGDAFRFVMDYHKMGFREALEYLAERSGVALTPWRPQGRAGDAADQSGDSGISREALLAANRAAADFYRVILQHPEHGSAAREFIARRGLTPSIVQQFQIGAAPDRWDGLAQTVEKMGLGIRPFVAAGLLKPRDSGGHYDALRHRAIFPITDSLGRVIAFGGRRLREEDDPKYLNSPETALFNKSATLYALPQASAAIRSSGVAIVTEGYMDAIACHQAGVTNAVATLGTALTAQSARVLARLCQTVILLFDGDEAGQRAADRAVEVFFSSSLDIKIATLQGAGVTDAKDPDELLKKPDGRRRLDEVLAKSVDALEYRFDRLRERTERLGLGARAAAVEQELDRLSELGLTGMSPVRQEMVVRRIAALAGVDGASVRKAVQRNAGKPRRAPEREKDSGAGTSGATPYSKPRTSGEHALACLIAEPSLLRDLPEDALELVHPDAFEAEVLKKVANAVDRLRVMGQTLSTRTVLANIDDPEAQQFAASWAFEVSRMMDHEATTSLRSHLLSHLQHAKNERRMDAARRIATGDGSNTVVSRLSAIAAAAQGGGTAPRSLPKPPPGAAGSRASGR